MPDAVDIFGDRLLLEFKGADEFGHPGREAAGEFDFEDDLVEGKTLPVAALEPDIRGLRNADGQFTIEGHPHIIAGQTFVGLAEITYPGHGLGVDPGEVELELVQGRAFPLVLVVHSDRHEFSPDEAGDILIQDSGAAFDNHIIHAAFDFDEPGIGGVVGITADSQLETVFLTGGGVVEEPKVIGIQVQADDGVSAAGPAAGILIDPDKGTHPSGDPGGQGFWNEIFNLISRPHYSVVRMHHD